MNTDKLQTHPEAGNWRSGLKQFTSGLKHRRLALSAILAMVVGCSVQAADISGVYKLVTVDGKRLPATVSHEGATLQIRTGAFTIETNGNCNSKMTFVPPPGKEVTVEVAATYKQAGTKLDMRWKGAGRTTGTVEGKTFTMENEGMLLVYQWESKIGALNP